MQRVPSGQAAPGASWGEDTVYCEATCAPEDILYEGSEDEDYESPAERRLRYEAAGQRFLDGVAPFLLTASLMGPFDKASGWTNPWRSKHRTARPAKDARSSRAQSSHSKHPHNSISVPETVKAETQDSLECHLPSPESLKHAPVKEQHPYLEKDELDMVQNWRQAVPATSPAKDGFWVSTPTESVSVRKRKANDSQWLKKAASKRQRTEPMESSSINSPVPARVRRARTHDDANTADSLTVEHSRSTKLPSTRQTIRKPDANDQLHESEDELSREQTAAALTLSSPISQQNCPGSSSISPLGHGSQIDDQKESTSMQICPKDSEPGQDAEDEPMVPQETIPSEGQDAFTQNVEPSPNFATQQDQSFCFRMRTREERQDQSPNEDTYMTLSQPNDPALSEESWSGLSSVDAMVSSPLREDLPTASKDFKETNSNDAPDQVLQASSSSEDNIAADSESSDLSSLSSDDFDGFEYVGEPVHHTNDEGTGSDGSAEDIEDAIEVFPEGMDDARTESTASDSTEDPGEISQDDTYEESDDEEIESDVNFAKPQKHTKGINKTPSRPSKQSMGSFSSQQRRSSRPQPVVSSHSQPVTRPTGPLCLKPSIRRSLSMSSSSRPSTNFNTPPGYASTPGPRTPKVTLQTRASSTSMKLSSQNKLRDGPVSASEKRKSTREPKLDVARNEAAPKTSNVCVDNLTDDSAPEMAESQTSTQSTQSSEGVEEEPLTFSQQSPWAASKFSQHAKDCLGRSDDGLQPTSASSSVVMNIVSPVAQSPWTHDSVKFPMAAIAHGALANLRETSQDQSDKATSPGAQLREEERVASTSVAATPTMANRPTTPEPQFTIKSFASFMSPSPERRPRSQRQAKWRSSGSRLPSTQGILASAMKNPWSTKSERRVSWAIPDEDGTAHTVSINESDPRSSQPHSRASSPPPPTPIADLPTSKDSKFHDHFSAVARRTNTLRQFLLPTESQRTVGSPDPQAMAEKFLAVDEASKEQPDETEDKEEVQDLPALKGGEASQDSMDIVEDVFREMSDFLETWDVDAELNSARKGTAELAPQVEHMAQSPW